MASVATRPKTLKNVAMPSKAQQVARQMRTAHWILLVVVPVLLCSATAFGGAMFLKPVFAARAEIMLHLGASGEGANRHLGTQSAIVRSYAVLDPVSKKFPLTAEMLEDNLEVDFPLNGSIMELQYSNPVGNVAVNILQAIIDSYNVTLGPIEARENTAHEIISGPYLLDDPVGMRPLQAAAVGAAIGLLIAFGSILMVQRLRGSW